MSVWTRNGEANALVIIYVELFIVMLNFRGALQARTGVRVRALVGERTNWHRDSRLLEDRRDDVKVFRCACEKSLSKVAHESVVCVCVCARARVSQW